MSEEKIIEVDGRGGFDLPLPEVEGLTDGTQDLEDAEIDSSEAEFSEDDAEAGDNHDGEGSFDDSGPEQDPLDVQEDSEREPSELDLGISIPDKGDVYVIKLPNGDFFRLPAEGVTVEQKVNGEIREFGLHDQLRVAGGEQAIETRLARAKAQEEEALQVRAKYQEEAQKVHEKHQMLVSSVMEQDPIQALSNLAREMDVAPGKFMEKMVMAVRHFEDGVYRQYIAPHLGQLDPMTPQGQQYVATLFQNYLRNIDHDYTQSKLQQRDQAELSARERAEQQKQRIHGVIAQNGITEDHARKAVTFLRRNDPSYSSLSEDQKLQKVVQTGKAVWMMEMIDYHNVPTELRQNSQFINELGGMIDPRVHDQERVGRIIAALRKEYKSSPLTKAAKPVVAKEVKKMYSKAKHRSPRGKVVEDFSQLEDML